MRVIPTASPAIHDAFVAPVKAVYVVGLIANSGVKELRHSGAPILTNGLMLRSTFFNAAMPLTSLFFITGCVPVQQLQSVAAAGGALANSMAGVGEQTTLSVVELRQLQARDLSTTKAAAFASVMTVLLDSGYRVISADLESGLITATSSTTGRLRLDPMGLSKANQTPMASAYVEERDSNLARVRIVFSIGTAATGQLASSGERAILEQGIYNTFFSRLEEEVEQRPAATTPIRVQVAAPSPEADLSLEVEASPADEASSAAGEGAERQEAPQVEDQIPEE